MDKRKFLIIIACIGVFAYLCTGLKNEQPAENQEVVAGFGVDEEKKGETDYILIAPSSVYTFEEGEKISSSLRTGIGNTPASTRENRQLVSNKRYILGLEKIYLFSERISIKGLRSAIEVFFRNSYTNDQGYVAICRQKPEDIFKLKFVGYPSSADYIEGIIKNSKLYNFFSTNYKISDLFLNLDTEGTNIIIPFIDVIANELKMAGLCIFKQDKLVATLNMDDTKALNMLSDTTGKGVISLVENSDKYLDYYASVKRSVKVYKLSNKYKYVIDLKLWGDIVSNTMYTKDPDIPSVNNEMKTKLEKEIKQSCEAIVDKLKYQYKVDALQLGQYAAAKYGRDKSIDWDVVFTNADININVKVQIDRIGRGNYILEK